jgi:hypothetical protein
MLSDWQGVPRQLSSITLISHNRYHKDYLSVLVGQYSGVTALSTNGLINGKMNYPCDNSTAGKPILRTPLIYSDKFEPRIMNMLRLVRAATREYAEPIYIPLAVQKAIS